MLHDPVNDLAVVFDLVLREWRAPDAERCARATSVHEQLRKSMRSEEGGIGLVALMPAPVTRHAHDRRYLFAGRKRLWQKQFHRDLNAVAHRQIIRMLLDLFVFRFDVALVTLWILTGRHGRKHEVWILGLDCNCKNQPDGNRQDCAAKSS